MFDEMKVLGVVIYSLLVVATAGWAVLCVLAFAFLPGACMRGIGRNRGPDSRWVGGFLAVLIVSGLGAATGFFGAMLYSTATDQFDLSLAFPGAATGLAFAVVAAFVSIVKADDIAASIRRERDLAPQVSEYALRRFADILNTGGLIKSADLSAACKEDKSELLAQLATHLSEIGHVIGTYTTTSVMVSGAVIVPMTVVHSIYGISKEDLLAYPERIASHYRKW